MREKILMLISNNRPWFSLIVNVLVGIIFAFFVILINREILPLKEWIPEFLLTDSSLAETILSTLAGAWLSVTTFTFSVTMVVLTTYSSNYSPRIVEDFLQNKTTMRVLGTFIGGFVYNVSMLFFLNDSFAKDQVISSTVGILYAFWCIIQFVIFIFSVANAIQPQNLIASLYDETEKNIDNYMEKNMNERVETVNKNGYGFGKNIVSTGSGHLAAVMIEELMDFMGDREYIIVVEKKAGDFIRKGDTLAKLYSPVVKEDIDIEKYFPLGKKRYAILDYRYGTQKLLDISVRALSPGINDPNTAIAAIHSLGLIAGSLSKIDGCYDVITVDKEEGISSKIYVKNHVFFEDIFSIYSHILTYGQEDLFVVTALMDALEGAAVVSTKSNLRHLKEMNEYAYKVSIKNFPHPLDRQELEKRRKWSCC